MRQPGNGGLHALPALPVDLWICVLKLLPRHELGRAAGVSATPSTLAAENTRLHRQLATERAGARLLREKRTGRDAGENGVLQEENGRLREENGRLREENGELHEQVGGLGA